MIYSDLQGADILCGLMNAVRSALKDEHLNSGVRCDVSCVLCNQLKEALARAEASFF